MLSYDVASNIYEALSTNACLTLVSRVKWHPVTWRATSARPAVAAPPAPQAEVEFTVKCSYLEIYNETVADLLAEPGSAVQPEIREDKKKGMFVENLTEETVTSAGAYTRSRQSPT